MRTKQEITKLLTEYCKEFNLKIPNFNSYSEVKAIIDRYNNSCHYCGKHPHLNGSICSCEIRDDIDWWYYD